MAAFVEVSPPHGAGVPGINAVSSSGGGVELLGLKHAAARSHSKWRRIDAAGNNSAMQASRRALETAFSRGRLLVAW